MPAANSSEVRSAFRAIEARTNAHAPEIWFELVRIRPDRYFDSLFEVTRVSWRGLRILVRAYPSLWLGFRIRGRGTFPFKLARAIRRVDGETVAHHTLFIAEKKGTGFGKKLMRNQFKLYERLKVARVLIDAADEAGAYVWARFGFLPSMSSWIALQRSILARLEQCKSEGVAMDPFTERFVRTLCGERAEPRDIWLISDLDQRCKLRAEEPERKLGQRLLVGLRWQGAFDLRDEASMQRFRDYVGLD